MLEKFHLVFTAVVWFASIAKGSKLTFSATPGTVTPALTSDVTLTCSLHDTSPTGSGGLVGRDIHNVTETSSNIQFVTSVSILHNGSRVASVTEHHPARSLTQWSNMAVDGGVDDSTLVKGYLNVTLQYPTEDQLGRYECQIHGVDPVDDHDVMFTTSLDLTNDAPTITQLMDHIRALEIDGRAQRVDFDTLKKEKQATDVEVEGLKQELVTIKQEKQTTDVEVEGLKQELVTIKQELVTIKPEKQTSEVEVAGIKQKLDNLEKEHASSYSALSTSLNNTRHIETGTVRCTYLSPGANKYVTTKFSSPYTGAPPTVYISVGGFFIRFTTDVSMNTALYGSLGHVDMEGFTYTCSAASDSSFVNWQYMHWISFPTVL